MKFDTFDLLALIFVIVGAVNLGFIGVLDFDLLAFLLGGRLSFLCRTIFSLIGVSGIYIVYLMLRLKKS